MTTKEKTTGEEQVNQNRPLNFKGKDGTLYLVMLSLWLQGEKNKMRTNEEIKTEISNLKKVMKEIGDRCNCGSAPCNCGVEEDTITILAIINTLTWILGNNPTSPVRGLMVKFIKMF